MRKKRLRLFAGPNGSGKSTIKNIVSNYVKLGTYVNADEIKVELTNKHCLDFSDYEVDINKKEFIESLQSSLMEVTLLLFPGRNLRRVIMLRISSVYYCP